ncbi:MAG: trimethylamine methyltransferase family protein [Elusimicrobiota bacterium]
MRPEARLLDVKLIDRILDEAFQVLDKIGLEVRGKEARELLCAHGARFDEKSSRVHIGRGVIETALKTVRSSFKLYDVRGNETHDFSDAKLHFTPGSSAINFLDHETKRMRRPLTEDYVRYAKVVSKLDHIAAQSTAMIPSDVPELVADSYRLYLGLLHCEKPVITGMFTAESFKIMRELLLAVRKTPEALKEKPLALFTCCPTSPLKWSEVPCRNLLDCVGADIPVELVTMPLAGFNSPVTLTGTLIQHTAEILGGVVIGQLARPGARMLYGSSAAAFDVRYETTPMGAIETMMLGCSVTQIGKKLGLPTQAYIALSDAKLLDSQAGLETGIGATLAALTGVNSVSGPGMLDFENCHSTEKLVVDNEICGMMLRLSRGIEPKDDFPSIPLFEELLRESHLLIAKHSRRHLRKEHIFPGPVIDRANSARWLEEGGKTLEERAHAQLEQHLKDYVPSTLDETVKKDLAIIMEGELARGGKDALPAGAR